MAKKSRKPKKPKIWVCRGCCCGRRKKHPGVDHDRLLEVARKGAQAAGCKLEVTECLGPCGQGNIVVARVDGQIRWFRRMNDEPATWALVHHLADGRPLADVPPALRRKVLGKKDGKRP